MKGTMRRMSAALLIALLAAPMGARGGSVVLKKAWVAKYKNRATIEVKFTIDHAHKKPNRVKDNGDDGDLHMSGRAPKAGLPIVAEIVNAAEASQKNALLFVKANEGKDAGVTMKGVWRLWFEHPSSKEQKQFDPVPKPTDTNPKHVFEVHPVTGIGPNDILKSFVPIEGFTAYNAQTAFPYYEKIPVTVQSNGSAVTLISPQSRYNYAEFMIELAGPPHKREDGYTVMAIVRDAEGAIVVDGPRRMVFVEGTKAANAVKDKKKGYRMRVLGIPRVNLEAVAVLAKTAGPNGKKAKLPYEMIIVGHFPEE